MSRLFVCLIAIALVIGCWTFDGFLHGSRRVVTPLKTFTLAWILTSALYLANPINLGPVSARTWTAILIAFGSFVYGYAAVVVAGRAVRRSRPEMTAAFTPSLRPARKLFAVLLCLGGGLFVIFLTFALQHYGLANLGEYLFRVRLDLGVGDVPPGFYFLYFAEPLPPMALVMAQLQPQRRRRYYVIAGLAFLALTLTSGRTNVIKAALWCLCTLLLDGKHRWMRVKGLTYIAVCAAAGLLFFIVAGNLIGKNFSHSELSGALGSDASLPTQLAVPYLYATGALPTLEHVMDQPTSPASRGTTIRPILQLAAIVDPQIQVPAKVQPFYNVPYRFNVSTFIGPLYRDLGVIGMAIYTALLGAVSALLYVSYVRSPTPCLRLLVALFMVTGTLTVGDLPLNNLSYVLQIALLGFAAQMEHLGVSRTRPFQTQELPQASDLERSGFKVDAEAPRL